MRAHSTTSEDIKQELNLPNLLEHSSFPIPASAAARNSISEHNNNIINNNTDDDNDQKDNTCQLLRNNDDETWKAYLENPFTTAIMSMQGDEESATALGILYDYYKVPMEKRIMSNLEADKNQTTRNGSYKDNSTDSITSNLDAKCFRLTDGYGLTCWLDSDENVILNGGVTRLGMCEQNQQLHQQQQQQQYSPDGEYVTTSSYESMENINCATSLYETLAVAENVTSTTTSSNSLFTPSYNSPLPADYCGEFFEYIMEAPKSLKQKENEPTMSYINKGQYYCITLREISGRPWKYKSTQVMSVVQIVFGDGKQEEEQLRNWRYWHARQHTARQRVIDIADYKESCFIHEVDEFAHNAISFSWNVNDTAKIYVSCNCLSTDFSAQKGVKGQPLSLQIDTFLGVDRKTDPIHRGICQLKVFCDKGAERKIRDEGRKAAKKAQKNMKKDSSGADNMNNMTTAYSPVMNNFNSNSSNNKQSNNHSSVNFSHNGTNSSQGASKNHNTRRMDSVYFKTVLNLTTPPVHFVPDIYAANQLLMDRRRSSSSLTPNSQSSDVGFFSSLVSSTTTGPDDDQTFLPGHMNGCMDGNHYAGIKRTMSSICCNEGEYPITKFAKTSDFDGPAPKKRILIYVRKENDRIFDGIFLHEPTLKGLKDALEEKYHLQSDRILSVLRKSKKGILVKVDDNIIRHYSDEDAFIMEVVTEHSEGGMSHHVTLTVV